MKNHITHFYKISSRITLSALIISFSIMPAYSYDGQYLAFGNQSGLRSSINAGFRLTIPFGPTKKSADKVKYGFQINLRREYNNSGWDGFGNMNRTQIFNADILSLNFSKNGFKGLSLAGQQAFIYKNGVLMAAEGRKKKKGGSGFLLGIGIGLGVLAAGGVINQITGA